MKEYFITSLECWFIVGLVNLSFYRLVNEMFPSKPKGFLVIVEKFLFGVALCITPVIRWIYVVTMIITHALLLHPDFRSYISEKKSS